jgi:hypothetical protein
MFDFLRGGRRFVLLMLVLGCSFALGCKSHGNQDEAEHVAAKKPKQTGSSDEVANVQSQARGGSGTPGGPTVYSRSTPRAEDSSDEEETKKETYDGGDPDIYRAPAHKGSAHEKVVVTSHASTPTPTPNRPIDRPLDPSGRPLTSPSPGE